MICYVDLEFLTSLILFSTLRIFKGTSWITLSSFHYLNQSNCCQLDGVDDSKGYLATRRAMNVVGISSEEQICLKSCRDGKICSRVEFPQLVILLSLAIPQVAIFRVVAAILHLGNIEFTKGKEMDSSAPKDEKSWFHLRTAAELFMCDMKALENSLCERVIVTRGETITKWLDPEAVAINRDALAKIVYSRWFDWLVDKINNSIGQDPNLKSLIGVLDMYGFESFKTSSFEQFYINLTKEKLQQHFIQCRSSSNSVVEMENPRCSQCFWDDDRGSYPLTLKQQDLISDAASCHRSRLMDNSLLLRDDE
ncbi:hypothetical protein FXO38_04743 [Capsicum annuum]|nr:hypothetical protein FXO37_25889 [Capsicum annuum]KAF3675458.1 hypothetical protein FXO38_04743 [Capsicum annuum]